MLKGAFTSLADTREKKYPAGGWAKESPKLQQLLASAAQIKIQDDTPQLTLMENEERIVDEKRDKIRKIRDFTREVDVLLDLENRTSTAFMERVIAENNVNPNEVDKPIIVQTRNQSKSPHRARKAPVEEAIRFQINS